MSPKKIRILELAASNQYNQKQIAQLVGISEAMVSYHLNDEYRQRHTARQKARRERIKEELISRAGGACCKCGYDRCRAALDFHHVDPATKDPDFHGHIRWSLEKAIKQIEGCILVCSNCHREIHHAHLIN